MPQAATPKPHLIGVEFVETKPGAYATTGEYTAEFEVNVTWTGTPESPGPSKTYAGLLSSKREVALRDDDGTDLIKWTLKAIPVTAEFMVPRKADYDSGIGARTAKRTAELILKAAYVGCGYKTMFPLSQTGQL